MLSDIKHAVNANFFFQLRHTSAWCVRHSSAAAVQNSTWFLLCCDLNSIELNSVDYITRFMESYSNMNMSRKSAILKWSSSNWLNSAKPLEWKDAIFMFPYFARYYYYYYYKPWCLEWHYHAQMLQGHLTNTKQLCVNSDAAQVLASSPKDVQKSTVFSCCRKAPVTVHLWQKMAENSRHGESCSWKCTVSQDPSSHSWNDQCRRGSRPQVTAGTAAGCQMQGLGEVP